MRLLLLMAAGLLALGSLAAAQDGGAKSGLYRQVMDNERVRVFQANFRPGDKLPSRAYPTHLVVALTDGTLVFVPEGRTGYEVNFKTGETLWFPPLTRATENDSDKDVRVLVVEFKDGAAARSAKGRLKGKKARGPGRSAKPRAAAPKGAAPKAAGPKGAAPKGAAPAGAAKK